MAGSIRPNARSEGRRFRRAHVTRSRWTRKGFFSPLVVTILITAAVGFPALLLPGSIKQGTENAGLRGAASPDGTSNTPSQRWGAQIADDPAKGFTLLFGGSGGHITQNGVEYGDTWTYESGVWTDITPATCTNSTCPDARTYGGMAYYDHAGQEYLVMFGGEYVGTDGAFLEDTWIFNGSWRNVTPDPLVPYQNSPPALHYTSMAWDAADGYAVLYGGCTRIGCSLSSILSDQTWAFEGVVDGAAHWVNLTSSIHPPRLDSPGLTFDAADGYLLLFGGITVFTNTLVYENQTWSYTAATGWVNRTVSAENSTNTPSTRVWTMMAYYPTNGYTVLFAGQENQGKTTNPTLNDTWIYSSGAWTNITRSLSLSPHGRFGGAMAFDGSDNALLLFGGLSGTPVNSPLLGDTWWFSGTPGDWTNHTTPPVTYSVQFHETGLPSGSVWWVNLTNGQSFDSGASTLSFEEPKGTYSYSAVANGFVTVSGKLTVSGSNNASIPIRFSASPAGSSGLPIIDFVLIGGVVLVVAIAASILLLRRRRNPPSAPPTPESPAPGQPPSANP